MCFGVSALAFPQLYNNKRNNFDEMEKSLGRYRLAKLHSGGNR